MLIGCTTFGKMIWQDGSSCDVICIKIKQDGGPKNADRGADNSSSVENERTKAYINATGLNGSPEKNKRIHKGKMQKDQENKNRSNTYRMTHWATTN